MVSPFKIQACVEIHFSMRSYSECSFFANFHLVLVKLMCPALSARIFDWAVEAIWIWHFKRKAASWSPIKHWCRHVRPTDWEVGHPCYNRSPHSTGLLYHILWSHEGKMNATLHVYCFFPVPGSYTIAYFVLKKIKAWLRSLFWAWLPSPRKTRSTLISILQNDMTSFAIFGESSICAY